MEKSNKISVSIIVPMYNVEKYIERCVDSLVKLTINKEIILINDGSTDKTLEIVKKLKKKYKEENITIVSQKNKGAGYTRNVGIKKSKGEYISFVDGDDMIIPEKYEELFKNTIKDKVEIGVGRYNRLKKVGKNENNEIVYEMSEFELLENSLNKGIINGLEYIVTDFELRQITPCAQIYKKDFILKNKLFFKANRKNEDVLFYVETLFYAKKIRYYNIIFYCYFIENENSLTATENIENRYDYLKTAYEIYQLIKNIKEDYIQTIKDYAYQLFISNLEVISLYYKRGNYYYRKKYKKFIETVVNDEKFTDSYYKGIGKIFLSPEILEIEEVTTIKEIPIESIKYIKNGIDKDNNKVEILIINDKIEEIIKNKSFEKSTINLIFNENKNKKTEILDLKGENLINIIDNEQY